MERIYLDGSEAVRHAGSHIAHAAGEMKSAAAQIVDAVHDLRRLSDETMAQLREGAGLLIGALEGRRGEVSATIRLDPADRWFPPENWRAGLSVWSEPGAKPAPPPMRHERKWGA